MTARAGIIMPAVPFASQADRECAKSVMSAIMTDHVAARQIAQSQHPPHAEAEHSAHRTARVAMTNLWAIPTNGLRFAARPPNLAVEALTRSASTLTHDGV
ncbi:hypothetical protein GCM10025738_01960 [Microbacterium fluvii]